MILNIDIGKEIKRRLKLGVSQESLSFDSKISRKNVYKMELGKSNISINMMVKICEGLKVSVFEFINCIKTNSKLKLSISKENLIYQY